MNAWEPPPGVTSRLILVRHGEPEESARGRCYGKLDVSLSERGRRQMECVSRYLAAAPVSAVHTSPRRRARESAEIVARPHRVALVTDERLSEIDFGRIEGMSYDEVARQYPDLYRTWMERPTEIVFPEGESFADLRARVNAATAELRRAHAERTTALVTHGGVNSVILGEALGLPAENVFRLDQAYAGLSIIDYYREAAVVRLLNVVVSPSTSSAPGGAPEHEPAPDGPESRGSGPNVTSGC